MAQHSDSPGTPDRWLVLFLAALSYFTLYLHRNLVNYLQPPIQTSLDVSNEQIGLLATAFLLPYTMVQIGVGYLSDRLSRRTVLLFSLFASALSLGLSGLVWHFEELVALRVALALSQSASVPAIASLIADSFTPRTRSTAIGIYLASYNFSLVIAGQYGGMIADTRVWHLSLGDFVYHIEGWRAAHLIFALVGGMAALLVLALLREPVRTERRSTGEQHSIWQTLALALRVPTFWSLGIIFALQNGVVASIQYWLPRYLYQRFDLSLQDAGFEATIWIQSATIVGLFVGGWYADRLARWLIPGRTWVQAGGLFMGVVALNLLWLELDQDWLVVPMILFGIGTGMYQASLWAGTFEVMDPAARATAIGLLNVAAGVLASWWGPVIGAYVDGGGDLGSALAFLGSPLSLAVLLLLVNIVFLLPRDYRGPLAQIRNPKTETQI